METRTAGEELLETPHPSATLRARNPDLLHAPWMDGAMLHAPCPTVVTIHDLAQLKRRSEYLRTGLRMRLRYLAVQRAAGVIVPSETVAGDAVSHLRIERDRVSVIPEAADASMYPRTAAEIATVRARYSLPQRYLVWVGGLQHPDPAKPIARLAATPREIPLVLVGPTRPWAHELPDVILTGQVPDDDLAAIYSGAHALVLPSEHAGFGLSAVESLACGTPGLACEVPALREVLDQRAEFVAAGDLGALIAAAQIAERPAPPPPAWTWQDAGRATWGVYARAIAATESQRTAPRARHRRPATGIDGGLEAQ